MRYLNAIYTLIGIALLVAILRQVDLAAVASALGQARWGLVLALTAYLGVLVIDALTWQMALPAVPLDGRWWIRLWNIRLVGEAFNTLIPAGGLAGEPVKALLLKKHYGTDYRDGIASIIMARTVNMIALVPFIAGALVLAIDSDRLSDNFEVLIALACLGFAALTLAIFAIQRFKLSSLTGRRLIGRRLAEIFTRAFRYIHDVEERFIRFYSQHRGRFAVSCALALLQWFLGAAEIYLAMLFIGHPVSLVDAWIIEAVVQLVRSATFFLPANLGSQEAAFVFICEALTGSFAVGVALAVLRRLREVLWLGYGLALAARYSVKDVLAAATETSKNL